MTKEFIIWSNENLNLEDWEDCFEEENITSEYERWNYVHEMNDIYLDDERSNLADIKRDIIAIADLGLWNGRVFGYKDFTSVSDCLYCECDYVTWYIDNNGEFRCSATHHDGTNHYAYRAWKTNVSDEVKDEVREAIFYNNNNFMDLIRKYTESLGPIIAKVYGFKSVNDMF